MSEQDKPAGMPIQLDEALEVTYQRIANWIHDAMSEHQCCYNPATATAVAGDLLKPITDALKDRKEG